MTDPLPLISLYMGSFRKCLMLYIVLNIFYKLWCKLLISGYKPNPTPMGLCPHAHFQVSRLKDTYCSRLEFQ